MRLAWVALLGAACVAKGEPDPSDPGDEPPQDSDTSDDGTFDVDQRRENLASAAGDFALDLLTDAVYDHIIVEVDYVGGRRPAASAMAALRRTLLAVCTKPGGVEIVVDDEIPEQGAPSWSVDDGEQVEVDWRDRYRDPASGVAVMYMLYLDGGSDRDSSEGTILGYAYHGSSIVMFPDAIGDVGGPLGGLGLLADPEEVVVAHEAGHLLGLVANGVPMVTPHQDEPHGAHDASDACLMYWAVEGPGLGDILTRRVPTFDDACLADIEAAGGRPAAEARRDL
ncbi:MAG TPA: hypothetical protein PKA64_19240 [Myxococcota bacterium]|nr:hypothetical protein [Myxococcota bacterium]